MSKEPEPRAPRCAARRAFDWHQAAELLGRGLTIAAVAERIGCARATLSRKCRHDPVFQSWLARCREMPPEQDGHQLPELGDTLHRAIAKEVGVGNVRVVLWLADRLKLVTPPSAQTPDQELRAILNGLTAEELSEFEQLCDEPSDTEPTPSQSP